MEMSSQLEAPSALPFALVNGWVTEQVETRCGRENHLPLSNLNKSLKAMKPKSGGGGAFKYMRFLDMNTARKVLEYPHLGSLLRGLFTEKSYQDYADRSRGDVAGFVSSGEKMETNRNTNTITELNKERPT